MHLISRNPITFLDPTFILKQISIIVFFCMKHRFPIYAISPGNYNEFTLVFLNFEKKNSISFDTTVLHNVTETVINYVIQ